MTNNRLTRTIIHNASLFTPAGVSHPGWLLVEGRSIRAMGAGAPPAYENDGTVASIDAQGMALLPGFIDLHVHGAMGHEVMDADPDGLRAMGRFYASRGVTAFLPTTWTASSQNIRSAIDAVGKVTGRISGGATVLGVHMEGPYLNADKCGAQDARLIRRADRAEAIEFLDTGLVRLLALAPEFSENLWLIDECVRRGITVSLAHTAAGYEDVQAAVERGARHVTHTYNAMVGLDHRRLGTVGAVMAFPQLCCEIIADKIHVHPVALKILVGVKGTDGVVLVTDAIRGAGMPEGEYAIDERTVTIRDGAVRLPNGTLAGSILTMDKALKNIQAATGLPLAEVWQLSSLNAARQIGISATKGSLEVGKDADLVLLTEDYQVTLTMAEGEIVYRK